MYSLSLLTSRIVAFPLPRILPDILMLIILPFSAGVHTISPLSRTLWLICSVKVFSSWEIKKPVMSGFSHTTLPTSRMSKSSDITGIARLENEMPRFGLFGFLNALKYFTFLSRRLSAGTCSFFIRVVSLYFTGRSPRKTRSRCRQSMC